jgi:hypothetical protein
MEMNLECCCRNRDTAINIFSSTCIKQTLSSNKKLTRKEKIQKREGALGYEWNWRVFSTDRRHTGRLRKRDTLLTGEGGRGRGGPKRA